jgi:hypothetical protein
MATDPQPNGTPVDTNNHETHKYGIEPSGPRRDNPATAGPGPTAVRSSTPENSQGQINPSPEDANATPGTIPKK